jgi:hypothetical protein
VTAATPAERAETLAARLHAVSRLTLRERPPAAAPPAAAPPAAARTERERADARQRGRLRGLERARAAKAAALDDQRRRLAGDATGWHRAGAADWRLNAFEANAAAALLERHGWRAESINLAQGVALVSVRDLATRGHPLVAVLRRPGEAERWLTERGHGLTGRVPRPPAGVCR